MRSSNIGGQAVLEGIMMRNGGKYSVAVRKPDGEIESEVWDYHSVIPWKVLLKIPFIRGIFNFVDSLVLGMKTLMYSASFFEEEEEGELLTKEEAQKREKKEKIIMNITVVISLLAAAALFMILPYVLSGLLKRVTSSRVAVTVFEGVIRVAIFLIYIFLISRTKDIKRTFMYHGAEHKCINCIEHGLELNVENVRKSSKQHKRCGTSFLFFVMIVSVIFCFFITAQSQVMRIVIRLALLPVIAGVSYEIIKLAGNSDNPVVNLLSKPGMWVQNMTTKEPDDSMIEVAICAVEKVFYAYPEKELTEEEKIQYEECIKRRAERIPLQHITGVQEFMGLPFLVNEHVLIPRQDTEVLVEQALCLLEKEKKHKEIVRILDLCTGSGCILLSMLHYVRRKRKIDIYGVGSDISKEALAVAVENAKKLGIEAKFVQGDLFENVEGSFDMILSNPPYIRTSEIERLQEEVRFHDPIKALDGKEDGLYFYRIIVKESRQYLKRGGWLIFEIGSDQAEAVKTLLQEAGYENIEVKKDLAGLDRVVYGMYS